MATDSVSSPSRSTGRPEPCRVGSSTYSARQPGVPSPANSHTTRSYSSWEPTRTSTSVTGSPDASRVSVSVLASIPSSSSSPSAAESSSASTVSVCVSTTVSVSVRVDSSVTVSVTSSVTTVVASSVTTVVASSVTVATT